jgi:hypothetical protein
MFLRGSLPLLVSALCAVDVYGAFLQGPEYDFVDFNVTDGFDNIVQGIGKRQSNVELRILPLGASIVNGYMESSGNG